MARRAFRPPGRLAPERGCAEMNHKTEPDIKPAGERPPADSAAGPKKPARPAPGIRPPAQKAPWWLRAKRFALALPWILEFMFYASARLKRDDPQTARLNVMRRSRRLFEIAGAELIERGAIAVSAGREPVEGSGGSGNGGAESGARGARRRGGSGLLLAANHISWLDVIALMSLGPVNFVAKKEIRGWPLMGKAVDSVGSVFIDRSDKRNAALANAAVADRLRQGGAMAFFPEARTCDDGYVTMPFKPALFQAAIDAPSAVQFVVLRYYGSDGLRSNIAAYRNSSLLRSFLGLISERRLTVEATFFPPLAAEFARARDRHFLKNVAEMAIGPVTRDFSPLRPAARGDEEKEQEARDLRARQDKAIAMAMDLAEEDAAMSVGDAPAPHPEISRQGAPAPKAANDEACFGRAGQDDADGPESPESPESFEGPEGQEGSEEPVGQAAREGMKSAGGTV